MIAAIVESDARQKVHQAIEVLATEAYDVLGQIRHELQESSSRNTAELLYCKGLHDWLRSLGSVQNAIWEVQ